MILLTGATGFVGNAVLTQLMQQPEVAIRTYGRRAPVGVNDDRAADASPQIMSHVVGEISASADYAPALVDVDVVIHCAAQAHINKNATDRQAELNHINCDGTLKLARQAIAADIKRFVFISSIGVNGSHNQKGPFKYDDVAAPWDEYTQSKYAAELGLRQIAKETGLEVVIIRPPLVYGANAPGNFGKLTQTVRYGQWLPLGAVHNQRSFVALDNLVDLIITCVTHPHATNQVFLVSDDQDVSTTQLLEKMSCAAGKSPRLLPVPMSWLRLAGKLTGKHAVIERLCGNLQVDISHTKTTLGWQPPISLEEGIKRCFIEDKEGC
ncbi:NAD-dependent epimerase/dehydratase family protein [Aeromonas rivuli]|uniref:NAD-dependent epimerase/dehydratase family protein n=1 Tax=Aeromonas rivuli TaxID=648794 RepID=UPI001CCF57BD|nr:NAD-dependent epimerase/dehydratase family protein [Aeromonas rivuli]UBO72862.1 NAD-dependent epimerase/dehydratase family protein [Aeromonas rivuli]